MTTVVRCPRTGHAWPNSTAKFRLSALAQYLRCRRVGRHRLRRMQAVEQTRRRLTIHGDQDRRLEVGPWSLDVVAYVVAVLLRRESGCRPLTGIDPKTRALDVPMIYDFLAVAGRDVVAARVVRNFDDFPEELVRLLLARAYWSRKSRSRIGDDRQERTCTRRG